MKGKSKIQLALWALCAVLLTAVVSIGNLPVKPSYASDCLPCEGNFDCDRDVDGSDLAIFAADFGRTDCCGCQIGVPKTGQTTSYATGDDGDLQMGIPWPDPRFTDHEDGTVTDNLTGLMWTKNAQQIPGTKSWTDALTACNDLFFADYGDWRLPNVRELQSLIDYGRYGPALPVSHPFDNVQSDYYWSSTTYAGNTDLAGRVYMYNGIVSYYDKDYYYYVWPVRAGQ